MWAGILPEDPARKSPVKKIQYLILLRLFHKVTAFFSLLLLTVKTIETIMNFFFILLL